MKINYLLILKIIFIRNNFVFYKIRKKRRVNENKLLSVLQFFFINFIKIKIIKKRGINENKLLFDFKIFD